MTNMSIYTVEIANRAVAVFSARVAKEANEFANSLAFRSNLTVLEIDGKPLWDGTSTLLVRQALPEEQDRWQEFRSQTLIAGETDDEE